MILMLSSQCFLCGIYPPPSSGNFAYLNLQKCRIFLQNRLKRNFAKRFPFLAGNPTYKLDTYIVKFINWYREISSN